MLKNKMKKSLRTITKKKAKEAINESDHHHLRPDHDEQYSTCESLLKKSMKEVSQKKIPLGFFAVYAGAERERFLVPTSFLSHPLFKMLLQKAHDEYGFDQKNGLVVPCSVDAFQEVVSAVQGCNGRFDITKLFQEFQ
ncbi:hypothetical protein Ancab_031612 [Ancistrocladus abbreviatus]